MNRIIRTAQRGLSIIELMIALAISSLLILGVTQIYVDNKSNFFFQQGQSDNTENARYTLLILEEELRRVGYRIRPDEDPTSALGPKMRATVILLLAKRSTMTAPTTASAYAISRIFLG